jgi:Mlc titration factor MtfA (ptsG expression regulator)
MEYGFMVFLLVGGAVLSVWIWRRRRRDKVPPAWQDFVQGRVSFYRCLDETGRKRFIKHLVQAMDSLKFEGIRGYEPDETIRLMVAAGFATFFHGMAEELPRFRQPLIIYPGKRFSQDYEPGRGDIAGQALEGGPMLLAAQAVREGFDRPHDGFNPVLHELAHYLDFDREGEDLDPDSAWEFEADEGVDDLPTGLSPEKRREWRQVWEEEWEKARRGQSPFEAYAFSERGELFAVAVELFFEDPGRMKRLSPRFYTLLSDYFALDTFALYGRGAGPS